MKQSISKSGSKKSTNKLRVYGVVEAGFPTPSEELSLDEITLDDWIIRDRSSSFMLKVKGDSMKDVGILPDDFVIVERRDNAKEGDIVIARIDGSFTMKYLRRDKQGFFLESGNKAIKPLRPKESLSIEAIVIASVRKYKY